MKNQKLFEYMSREHNVLLLESEMSEIIDIVKEIIFEAQVETPSVSDNETKKKLCRVFAKCDMALKCEKNCSEFGYLMKCYEQ